MFSERGAKATAIGILVASGLVACSANIEPLTTDKISTTESIILLDVSNIIDDDWRHLRIKGKTNYQVVQMDKRLDISATGAGGAFGLICRVGINSQIFPHLEWTWRVDEIQLKADLSVKSRDDMAAAIFILFGDPGFLSNPDPVPTLRYVWTTDKHKIDTVIDNLYLPGIVKNIVTNSGRKT